MSRLTDAIKRRKSVRTFTDEFVSTECIEQLQVAIDRAQKPFGGEVKMELLKCDNADALKPSTYGVIRGARLYVLLWLDDALASRLSGGFAMESVVLQATEMGLGTCWVGGTFSAKSFGCADNPGMRLTAVCPIGHAASRAGLVSGLMSLVARSGKRKPMGELFRNIHGAEIQSDSKFYHALEMMRLAPSSVNSQPWRAIVCDDRVDFYSVKSAVLNDVDMGIGLCHFALTLSEESERGHFAAVPPEGEAPRGWRYVMSWISE